MMHYSQTGVPPQQWVDRLIIAYRDTGEIARFDPGSGEYLVTLIVSPGSTWYFAHEGNRRVVAENVANPLAPDRVYRLSSAGTL